MMKKLVSFLLVVSMVLTVLPMTALAAKQDDTVSARRTAEAHDPYGPEESAVVQPQSEMAVTPEELEEAVAEVMLTVFDPNQEPVTVPKTTNDDGAVPAPSASQQAQGYVERHASQALVDYIKIHENAVLDTYYPMWDVSQWSIGYGSRCPSSPPVRNYTEANFASEADYERFMGYVNEGMPQDEATQLLHSFLTDAFEPAVNNVAKKYNIYLTQNQFDALLDFSYALGAGWSSGSRMRSGLINDYHGDDWTDENSLDNPGWYFINAMGTWCHVGSAANHGAATRRVQDLEVFRHGDYYDGYYQMNAQGAGHYTYLIFNANGGKNSNPDGTGGSDPWSTTNRFYFVGAPYGSLMNCSRDGYYFDGWYTAASGGTKITADTIAQMNDSQYYAGITVYAHWSTTPTDPEIGAAKGDGVNGGKPVDKAPEGQIPTPPVTDPTPDPEPENPFTDVTEDDWFYEWVLRAHEMGVVNGVTATTFVPEGTLTRAQAVTMLFRLSGQADTYVAGSTGFRDVNPKAYYADAVSWAVENGIVKGMSATEFRPHENITREQMAKILYGYAQRCGKNMSYSAPQGYTDFDQISGWALPSMCWAVTHEIMKGDTSTTLSPGKTTTRAQAATIFVRFLDTFF